LGWRTPPEETFVFNVLVQVATLGGVFAYFWKDITRIVGAFIRGLVRRQPFADPQARLGWYLILATIPAGLFGLAVRGLIEDSFNSPTATAFTLLVTAALLVIAEKVGSRTRCIDDLNWKDSLWFGVFQALSAFSGISRSGSTITGGMIANFRRQDAARFSFLMSIPIMLAAGLLETLDLISMPNLSALLPVFIPGFIVAAITGYLVIRWLLGYLVNHSLYVFAAYCVVLSLVTLAVGLL
jgi:undecaprenyl-diphosphatase